MLRGRPAGSRNKKQNIIQTTLLEERERKRGERRDERVNLEMKEEWQRIFREELGKN